MIKINKLDSCPQLTSLMNLCHDRVRGATTCPIEERCIMWYDRCIDDSVERSCEELIKEFLEMRDETSNQEAEGVSNGAV